MDTVIMEQPRAEELFLKGLHALDNEQIHLALAFFEQAATLERTPLHCSYLAYCLAKGRFQFPDAISLCREAIKAEPGNALHYFHLGRVYVAAGRRKRALGVLRRGLTCGDNAMILRELATLGERKRPVISSLPRSHPVNKYLGIMLKKIGLR